MVKSTGLSPSPWGVPTLLVKGAFISALFILVLMCVLLNKNCMSLSSTSSTMFFRICRRISLSMVSNAADMSIPVIFIFMFSVTVFAASHLWVQTTSEVLCSGLKPLWLCDRYFSMLGLILSSVSKESTFLKVLRSVIGLKLFGGPLGLPGFGMAIRTPELMSSSSWFVNVLFNMFAIVWSRRGVEYFSSIFMTCVIYYFQHSATGSFVTFCEFSVDLTAVQFTLLSSSLYSICSIPQRWTTNTFSDREL